MAVDGRGALNLRGFLCQLRLAQTAQTVLAINEVDSAPPVEVPRPKSAGRPKSAPTAAQIQAYKVFHSVHLGGLNSVKTARAMEWFRPNGEPDRTKAWKAVDRVERWQKEHGVPSTSPRKVKSPRTLSVDPRQVDLGARQDGRRGGRATD